MTLRVGNHFSISSTNNTSSKNECITRINNDDTIEVKLTPETTIRKLKIYDVTVIPLYSITAPFARKQPEYLFLQSNQHQV